MTDLGPLELERCSTAEMVAASLRERVLAGEFKPGTPMRESGLAPQLGVSRATMREALQHLVHEGLLTYYMHRGMLVTHLQPKDVDDIYRVRLVIELAAVRAGGYTKLGAVEEAVAQHAAAVGLDDVSAIVEADMHFHQQLVNLMDSPRLGSCHSAALGQLRLALNLLDRSKGDLQAQVREHRRIVRALKGGEPGQAAQLLADHLERARRNLVGFLAHTS